MLSVHRAFHTLGMKNINISTNIVTVLCLSEIKNYKNNSRSFMTKDVRIFRYLYSTSNSVTSRVTR